MASLMAPVKDGELIGQTVEEATNSTKTRKVSNSMDKEAFLQLLVAQMQYQDPLEPTSNTEYVAQLATFSELEAMTNLNESMSVSRASQLVGKKVIVQKTLATTGDVVTAEGTVDYVLVENNKAYLVVDGEPYSIDDLYSVMTDEYWKKYQDELQNQTSVTAQAVVATIASLPEDMDGINKMTFEKYKELVTAIRKAYDGLSATEKNQVPDEAIIKLIQAEHTVAKIEAEQPPKDEENKPSEGETEGDSSDDKTEGTEKA